MSIVSQKQALRAVITAALVSTLLGGCAYDYLNHSDRVSYTAGNAVQANLARETINPSKKSQNDTRGLGKNGNVVPDNSLLFP